MKCKQLELFPESFQDESCDIDPFFKVCKSCKQQKPNTEFVKADGQHRATRNRCKDCCKQQANIREHLRSMNPPPKDGDCPICSMPPKKWVLDHCHVDMTFRGYICAACNAGIGLLQDDPVILEKALNYLRK